MDVSLPEGLLLKPSVVDVSQLLTVERQVLDAPAAR
jgi:hypothetical protein